jgi:hypothetical protein
MTNATANEIRKQRKAGNSTYVISEKTGIPQATVWRVVSGKTKKWRPKKGRKQ